ncbi:bacterio-opsin activator domain-containing protein [Haladaptatus sp. GCM10025707]|uniref:bacterio-opsin activator domain-containing protein n=1 Tax=unclassified Haladaptatus TaxID=2622732 RepID=UPI0023E7A0AF|nr:bacterio-opsin activator domain-containing protein [Haladaptatus sp. QDMS2]
MAQTAPAVLLVGRSERASVLAEGLTDHHDLSVRVVTDEAPARSALTTFRGVLVVDSVPGGDDHAFVERARASNPALPILYRYEAERDAADALAAGATQCLPASEPTRDSIEHLARAVGHQRSMRDTLELEAAIESLPDIFFLFDMDGTFRRWNANVTAVTGYTDEEVRHMGPTDFFGEDVALVRRTIHQIVDDGQAKVEADLVTKHGRTIPIEFTGALLTDDDGNPWGVCGIGRDVSVRRRREDARKEQARRLRRLNHINRVIRDVNAGLVQATTRLEIAQTVCERLIEDDRYQFAWIGEYHVAADRVEPTAWAGEGQSYLEARPTAGKFDGGVTAKTAILERESQVAMDITADSVASLWREAALDQGFRSALATPLVYNDQIYGVLALYADEPNAFDRVEKTVFAELGQTVAAAMNAAEARTALMTDTVTELEFVLTDQEDFLVRAAQHIEAQFSLDGFVRRDDGTLVEFITVHGIDAETLADLASRSPDEFAVSIVSESESSHVVQLEYDGESVVDLVGDYGGTVKQVISADGEVRVIVELPTGTDVAAVVAAIESNFAELSLVAQRKTQRERRSSVDFLAGVETKLTDRQHDVLQMAYLAGFFDWPRAKSGSEMASLLGISHPTFSQHLRIAERKVFEVLFDEL